jgi:hypothetical protein
MEVYTVLTMDLGTMEYFDGGTNEFLYDEVGVICFEYSLKVLYEWEAKWKKPFLRGDRTDDELLDFYKMMALNPIKEESFTNDVMVRLSEYIGDSNTATRFSPAGESQNDSTTIRKKDYTAEEIYALMIMNNVPLEFENRNLNRLLTVLKIIATYNNPPKNMSQEEILRQNRELNKQRKEQYQTKG